MVKLNWTKIRNEYINGHISYAKLAAKHKVSLQAIKDRGTKEKWVEQRKKQQTKIQHETNRKTIEKLAEKESDLVVSINSAAEELLKKIQLATEQLDVYLQKDKRKYTRKAIDPETGKTIYVDVEEEVLKPVTKEKINAVGLKQLASALKDIQSIQLAGKGEVEQESPSINITICPAKPFDEEGESEE